MLKIKLDKHSFEIYSQFFKKYELFHETQYSYLEFLNFIYV